MKNWLDSLQSREYYLIFLASVLAILIALYLVIWSPAVASRDHVQTRVDAKRDTVAWMLQKKQEVEHLKRINPNSFKPSTDSNRSLLAIVDSSAKQMDIRPGIKRIEPENDDTVQLWLEDIAFDSLITLLGELENKNNVEIANASFNRSQQIGKVTGEMVLVR